MKGVEMFGYVFTVGRIVFALAGVATAIGAYGFYELRRRANNSRKKTIDVSDVLEKHFGASEKHPSRSGAGAVNANNAMSHDGSWKQTNKNECPTSSENRVVVDSDRCHGAEDVAESDVKPRVGLLDEIDTANLPSGFCELVKSRVALLESIEYGKDDWGIKAVDFHDELLRLVESAEETERPVLLAILSRLGSELSDNGFELIKLLDWDPELQDAVVVTTGGNSGGVKVIDTISSGVKRRGSILRKQEVSILTSKKEN